MRPLINREDVNKYCCVTRLPLINRLKGMMLHYKGNDATLRYPKCFLPMPIASNILTKEKRASMNKIFKALTLIMCSRLHSILTTS